MNKLIILLSFIFFANKLHSQFFKIGEKYVLHKNLFIPKDKEELYRTGEQWTCVIKFQRIYDTALYLINTAGDSIFFATMEIMSNIRPKLFYSINEYNNLISENGIKESEKILDGDIWKGMTKKQAILSQGPPERISKLNIKKVPTEQFIYTGGSMYLYFKNGKLYAIR